MKNHIVLFVFISLSCGAISSFAQFKTSDISKFVYYSSFGGLYSSSEQITLEIKSSTNVRMYSTVYYLDGPDALLAIIEGGSRTISAEEFDRITKTDSTIHYFLGKITSNEYSKLADLVLGMGNLRDTTHFHDQCCCDIPYRKLEVYFKNGKHAFLECDRTENFQQNARNDYLKGQKALLDYLDKLANKEGYKRALCKFKF